MPALSTEKARSIYTATKDLRFCDITSIDIKDRLALATVAAGFRRIGVLEGDGVQLERIRDVVVNHGIHTVIARSVWSRKDRQLEKQPLLRLLDQVQRPSTGKVLWFCADSAERKRVKAGPLTKKEAGILLGYPGCCVDFEVEVDAKFDLAFLEALVAKVGHDEQAILRALKQDVPVEINDDIPKLENISRTDVQFPFLMHIACDSCLESTTSPSAELNASYRDLARNVDPAFHDLILQVRVLNSKLREGVDEDTNEQIIAEMDRLHRAAYRVSQRSTRRSD